MQIYPEIFRKKQYEPRPSSYMLMGGCDVWWVFLCLLYDIWIYMLQAELLSKHVTWHFQALRWAWPWKGNWKSTSRPSALVKTGWQVASCPGNTGWTFSARVGGSLAPIGAGSLTPIGVGGVGGMGRMGTYMSKYEIDLRPNSTETSQLSSLLYPSLLYCNSSLLYCSRMYSSLLYFFSTPFTLLYSTLFSLLFLFCLLCIVKSPWLGRFFTTLWL